MSYFEIDHESPGTERADINLPRLTAHYRRAKHSTYFVHMTDDLQSVEESDIEVREVPRGRGRKPERDPSFICIETNHRCAEGQVRISAFVTREQLRCIVSQGARLLDEEPCCD